MQHERAPRLSLSTQHLAAHKLGYNLSSQAVLFPSHTTPLSLSTLPTYPSLAAHPPDLMSNAHSPFERTFPNIPMRHGDISHGITHLHPLFNSGVGPLGGFNLNPFKISLFQSPLHYSMPHSEYFSSNIFYPPSSSEHLAAESVMSHSEYLPY